MGRDACRRAITTDGSAAIHPPDNVCALRRNPGARGRILVPVLGPFPQLVARLEALGLQLPLEDLVRRRHR